LKEIHLIRHAESEANAAIDVDNPTNYFDAKITKKGKLQAQVKHEEYRDINFDAYFCSPLTRALETFTIIFPEKKPIITDSIREHLYHSCDVGRQPKLLKKEFPNFDFDNLSDYWWNNNIIIDEKEIKRETYDHIKKRLLDFINIIDKQDHKKIALVSHGTFLTQITGEMLENCGSFIWKL
jgi:broad specificity phosphatase PhoE